mgnify:CR=1 FL=1
MANEINTVTGNLTDDVSLFQPIGRQNQAAGQTGAAVLKLEGDLLWISS